MCNRSQIPQPLWELRQSQRIAGFRETGRVTSKAGQKAFVEYHQMTWTDAREASWLIGARPKYVAPANAV